MTKAHPNHFDLSRLRTGIKPFRLHWYPRLRSTSDYAALLRKKGKLFAPAIVLAGHQIAGRGRGSNTWWSASGSLTVTFVLPIDEQLAPHHLPLLAGLAVRNAVAEMTSDNGIALKWPNDLLYNDRKLGGLLCERVLKADLVGLGLNINVDPRQAPASLRNSLTSLQQIAGRRFDLTDVLIQIARHLKQILVRGVDRPVADLLREYDAHHALLGKRVTVITGNGDPPLSGRCEGLDTMGRLLLRSRSKLHHVIAGQVYSA